MMSRDLVGGIAAIVIGAVYLFFASQIRSSALDDSFGPEGMPQAYAWIMMALGAIVAVLAIVKARRTAGGFDMKSEWSGQGTKILRAGGLLAIGIAYLAFVNSVGYAPMIALLLAVTALYQGAALNWRTLAVAAAGAALLWGVFVLLLGVSMPSGILGL